MALTASLLFVSGAAALVYQVLWAKQLSLVVGVDVHAITIAISAFFAGLGFGGLLIGRLADGMRRPVRFYAGLELSVAVTGVAATWGLARIAPVFAMLEVQQPWLAWLMLLVIVAIPPFLMGGTLPVLVRALAPRGIEVGAVTGRLYAANTTGAIVGALGATFLLIPGFGVQGAAFVAALANVAAALGSLALQSPTVPAEAVSRAPAAAQRSDGHVALILYAVAGGIALGYEVVWSQAIVQFLSTRVFAFSIVLATYLVGLALGALWFARRADRVRDPWTAFATLIAGAGLVGLAAISSLSSWVAVAQTALEAIVLNWTGNDLAGMSARFAVAAIWVVLLPTLLLGAAFPVAIRLIAQDSRIGRDVGATIGLNTIGGLAGVALTGLVLVPSLGLIKAMAALALAAAALGVVAIVAGRRRTSATGGSRPALVMAAMLAATVALSIATPSSQLGDLLAQSRRGSLVTYEESWGGTVAVLEQGSGARQFRRLYIQGVSNSGDAMPSLRYMRLQALLPLILHDGEPRSALVIGLGTGITAGALMRYPLETGVVAELLPAVLKAAPRFKGNYGAPSDPRLDIRLRDGRRELLRSEAHYDVITLEPPPPAAAGVVNLYSSDFYRIAQARLRPKGIMAQWLPLGTQNDEDTRSLVRSFLDVFPNASLWTTDVHEMLLIGSDAPLVLDVPRILRRFDQPEVSRALAEVGIANPAALLATWVTDRAGLERYVGNAPAVTDDRPRIEYAGWAQPGEALRVLPQLLALRTKPPLEGAGPAFRTSVAMESDSLLAFYDAVLSGQTGDRAHWARSISPVMNEDGQNPYYLWFVGGARR